MRQDAFQDSFLDECAAAIGTMECTLVQLPGGAAPPAVVDAIFRVVHSIKGGAATVGLDEMSSFAHTVETLLHELRAQRIGATQRVCAALFQSVDLFRMMVASRHAGTIVDPQRVADLQLELALVVAANAASAPPADGPDGGHPTAVRLAGADPGRGDELATVRVSAAQLDSLVVQVSGICDQHRLLAELAQAGSDPTAVRLREQLAGLRHALAVLLENVGGLRTVPISRVFERFPRLVRDLAQQLGKQVELHVAGGATPIDGAVLEKLGGALIQLVRNAVDHGFEPPAARRVAGKPGHGTLSLDARTRDDAVVVEVRDDGAGLSRDAILQRARSAQLIGEDRELTEAEVDSLIFLPGLSTREAATEVSGRGVGMDVVRRNLRDIGATVEIDSVSGRGCRFTITVPRHRGLDAAASAAVAARR